MCNIKSIAYDMADYRCKIPNDRTTICGMGKARICATIVGATRQRILRDRT